MLKTLLALCIRSSGFADGTLRVVTWFWSTAGGGAVRASTTVTAPLSSDPPGAPEQYQTLVNLHKCRAEQHVVQFPSVVPPGWQQQGDCALVVATRRR